MWYLSLKIILTHRNMSTGVVMVASTEITQVNVNNTYLKYKC